MVAYVYMLRCRDGKYYVGSTRGGLERRIDEHNQGKYGGYTRSRCPVTLVYYQEFERIEDAISAERKLKGWSRAKKEALIDGDFAEISRLARRKGKASSFDARASLAAQDEGTKGGLKV